MTVSVVLSLSSTLVVDGDVTYVMATFTNTGATAVTVQNVFRLDTLTPGTATTPQPASQNAASIIGQVVPASGGTLQFSWGEIWTSGTADQSMIVNIEPVFQVEDTSGNFTNVVPLFSPQLTVIPNSLYGNPSPSAQNFPARGQPDGRYNVNSGLDILFQGCL
jgi:hypothetical protein